MQPPYCTCILQTSKTTPEGFEPSRAEPIGLAGRRLNHSAKVSLHQPLSVVLCCFQITSNDSKSHHRGSNPGPSAYKADALPLSYSGRCAFKLHKATCTKRYFPKRIRHRRGSNPCGQSPLDFKSNSLTTRTQCHARAHRSHNTKIISS